MSTRPNILFIFADQLSARWLEDERVSTPNLDAFAEHSVRFLEAYTNCPLCTPYRACLLTGRYPSQTGVTDNGVRLPAGVPTIADAMNEAGYASHYIGKWHLSGEPRCLRWVPPEQRGGFQHFIGWESHHVDHNAGRIWRDDPDHAIDMPGHETDALTDIACDEIARLDADPFFMVVSYQAPHPPCTPPDEYAAMYRGHDLCSDPSADLDAWFHNAGWDADYGIQEFRERYFAEITHLDAAFGRAMAALSEKGIADNTIVIFTSDHGEMAGAHGLFGKGVMYDESIRVPLLIRAPGQPGRIVRTGVSTVDLHTTLAEIAGCASLPSAQGRSFAPLLFGHEGGLPPTPVIIDYRERCVVDGDWKFAPGRAGEPTLVFNRQSDPYEMTNIVDSSENESEKGRLREQLREFFDYRLNEP